MADTVDRIQVEVEVNADTSKFEKQIDKVCNNLQKQINDALSKVNVKTGTSNTTKTSSRTSSTSSSKQSKEQKKTASDIATIKDDVNKLKSGKGGKSSGTSEKESGSVFVAASEKFAKATEEYRGITKEVAKALDKSPSYQQASKKYSEILRKGTVRDENGNVNRIILSDADYYIGRGTKDAIKKEYSRSNFNNNYKTRDEFEAEKYSDVYSFNSLIESKVNKAISKLEDPINLVKSIIEAKQTRNKTEELIKNEPSRLVEKGMNIEYSTKDYKDAKKELNPYTQKEEEYNEASTKVDEYKAKLEELKAKLLEVKNIRDKAINKTTDAYSSNNAEDMIKYYDIYKRSDDMMNKLVADINDVQNKFNEASAVVETNGKFLEENKDKIETLKEQLEFLRKENEAVKAAYHREQLAVSDSATKYHELREKIKGILDKYKKLHKEQKATTKSTNNNSKATKKSMNIFSKFLDMFKRIAFYKVINSVINLVSKSLTEGTKNLYAYSKAMKTTFGDTMDKYATKLQTLRNSIGAISGQLIEAIMPILLRLISGATKLGNEIARIIALIRGQEYYSKAVDVQKEWNKELAKTQKLISGFDELNIFNQDAEDYASMFEEAETGITENKVKFNVSSFIDVDAIKEQWDELLNNLKQKWDEKIVPLGEKLKEAFSKIDLTSTIETILSIADAVGTIVFSVAELVGDAISITFNCEETQEIIDNVNETVQGLLDWVKSVVEKVSEKLSDILGIILPPTLKIVNEIVKFAKMILEFVEDTLGDCGWLMEIIQFILWTLTPILNVIGDIISVVNSSLKPVLKWVSSILNAILESVGSIFGFVYDLINVNCDGLLVHIETFIKSMVTLLLGPIDAIIAAFISLVNTVFTAINKILPKDKQIGEMKTFSLSSYLNSQWTWSSSSNSSKGKTTSGKQIIDEENMYRLASGGVVTSPTIAKIGEYSGASSNPEIVTPQNIMKETFDQSNGQVVNTLIQCCRQLISAIDQKDTTVQIGDETITNACARGNYSYFRRTGNSLI